MKISNSNPAVLAAMQSRLGETVRLGVNGLVTFDYTGVLTQDAGNPDLFCVSRANGPEVYFSLTHVRMVGDRENTFAIYVNNL
jgi:hypothetical protein